MFSSALQCLSKAHLQKSLYNIKWGFFFSMHSSFKYKQESISTVLHCFKGASPIFKDSNSNSKYIFYEIIKWKTHFGVPWSAEMITYIFHILSKKNAKRINILYLIYVIVMTLFLQKSSQGKEGLTFQMGIFSPNFHNKKLIMKNNII